MKSILKSALLLMTGTAMLASSSQAVTTNNGDLLLAFYQVSDTGVVGANTYVLNLGQASIWRENTQVGVGISAINSALGTSNIGAELSQAFGNNWSTDSTLRWGLVGGFDQNTSGTINGDRGQTSYITSAASNPGLGNGSSSLQPLVTGNNRNILRNSIEAFRTATNGAGTDIGHDFGAMIASGASVPTFEDFIDAGGAQFGINFNMLQAFGAGGVNGYAGALDIWRLVGGTSTAELNGSDTDLTSGLGNGNAVLGQGQYIGTITLDSNGNLSIVPEPSTSMLLALCGLAGIARRKR